jgi:type IX secretion system PorP/SprF family membrane protein
MRRLIFLACLLGIALTIQAQDFHFSQYWSNPTQLNPALSGLMEKNIRVCTNYRNQWFQEVSYSTYAGAIDANLFRDRLNGNFIGVGLGFYQDVEGRGEFKNNGLNLSLAYNQKLKSRKATHYLGFGLQAAYFSKQVNIQNVIYGTLFEINSNTDPIDFLNYNRKSIMDFGSGVNYFLNISDKHLFSGGFAVMHIGQPSTDFRPDAGDLMYRKYVLNMSARVGFNNRKLALMPLFLFQQQGPHKELNFGTFLQLSLESRERAYIYFGTQYRLAAFDQQIFGSDALVLALRGEFKSVDIGFSYDITTSQLRSAKSFYGGPELSLQYAFNTSGSSLSSYRQKSMRMPKF